MEKSGAIGLMISPGEYRAMMFFDHDSEEYENAVFRFDRAMDELQSAGDNTVDPREIERLLLEYSMKVKNKN